VVVKSGVVGGGGVVFGRKHVGKASETWGLT